MARPAAILLLLGAIAVITAPLAIAQERAAPPRPDLRPGDKLEVIDMGRIRDAEFVEFTPVGLIKVRFEDDSQLAFRPNFVRWAKGINPRASNSSPATGSSPTDIATTTSAPQDAVRGLRKWQDATQQFSIDAEFFGLTEGKVELKKADGKIILIPLEKLSTADQAVVKRLVDTAPNPFALNVTDPVVKPEVVVRQSISTAGKEFKEFPDTTWSVTPDPAPATGKSLRTTPIFIPNEERFTPFGFPTLDAGNGWLWVNVKNRGDKKGYFERIDLTSGMRLKRIDVHENSRMLDISPSGQWLAMMQKEYSRDEAEFQLWRISGQDAKLDRLIAPFTIELKNLYNMGLKNFHEVRSAEFVDDRHLFVQAGGYKILIDLQSSKVLYKVGPESAFCFSPGRKYFVTAVRTKISFQYELAILETLTGRCLGKLRSADEQNGSFSIFAFSNDGTRLAGLGHRAVYEWDVRTGQLVKSWEGIETPTTDKRYLAFAPHNQLLVDGKYFFSMRDGVFSIQVNWPNEYSNFMRYVGEVNGRSCYFVNRTQRNLAPHEQCSLGFTSYQLPGDDLQAAYEAVDISNLLVMKPGSRIRVEFAGIPDDKIAGFRTSLNAEFARNGWTLVDLDQPSDFEVLFTLKDGAPVELTYYRRGAGTTPFKVTAAPLQASMVLKDSASGKTLWGRGTNFSFQGKKYLDLHETEEEHVTAIRYDWKFFEASKIPTRLIDYPPGRYALVSGSVDSEGRIVPPALAGANK